MNAWNQWPGTAAYPTALPPGYGAPQPATAPAIPTAAAGIPTAAAAAAAAATVPYPAMPAFQAWPYAANPQAMTPWGAPTGPTPTGQATQWDQWNQWHQQYTQWQQQQYAAQAVSSTQPTHSNPALASVKTGVMPPTQPLVTTAPASIATNVSNSSGTTSVPTLSSNIKRANETLADSPTDAKKPRVDQPGWNQPTSSQSASNATKELEELSEAEKQFDEQFKNWEAQFDAWRQQNANHPDIEQYKAYEAKWASWREQLLSRREQMKKKREKLTESAVSTVKPEVAPVQPPLTQPPDPSAVISAATAATAIPQIYPGSYTATSTPPNQYQYQQHPPTQSQFMSPYGPQSTTASSQLSTTAPPQALSAPLAAPTPPSSGVLEPSTQQSEFLKGSSGNGIPGLDLLGGVNSSQNDPKSMPPVSFASSSQLPIQTPADSKPFDFPPPRQAQSSGFMGSNQQDNFQGPPPQSGSQSSHLTSSMPNQSMNNPGMIQPPGFPPSGFPPSQQQSRNYQTGPPPIGGYPGFPSYNSQTGNPTGFQGYPNQQYAGPPSGYQGPPGYQQPPGSGFQGQPPANFPPPGNFPSPCPGASPSGPYQGGYQSNGNYPNQSQVSSFQDKQPQGTGTGGFQDSSKSGYPYQPPNTSTQGNQPYQAVSPLGGSKDALKKIPGLMDSVHAPFGERNKSNESFPPQFAGDSGDRFNKNFPDDKFPNKFGNQDRFGSQDRFGGKENYGDRSKFGESGASGKDNLGFGLPKPKGYFSMQEMSVEEEYEKFHEYQQGSNEPEEEDKKDHRRSRYDDQKGRGYDDSRNSRSFDRSSSRFEDNRSGKFEESRSSRFEESRPSRFEEPKPSRYDGGRQSRFDGGGRPSRFDSAGSSRFQDERIQEQEGFNRPFENTPKQSPQPLGTVTTSPAKPGRTSRWGAPEPDVEQISDPVKYSGPLGPPYGPNAEGSDFRFAVIIDYNHFPADLGVPGCFEPLSVIDYTHGLHGINVEESAKDPLKDGASSRSGRVSSPQRPRDRDSRDDRNRWRDERGSGRGSSGGKRSDQDSDRDRRRPPWEEQRSYDRSRSPDRSKQIERRNESENDKDRRDRNKDVDRGDRERERVSKPRSPGPVEKMVPPPAVVAADRQEVPIDDILVAPGRNNRPPKIVIFLRGPPGSGKSFVAKLIKDKEVKNGGTAPRILSLDDYFMTDVEKEEIDPDSGRSDKKKVMEYEFEKAMEVKYRESLNKCFRKTVTDGYFPFIIIDANNDKVSYFDSMINFCKVRGFTTYIIEMELDTSQNFKRNIHKRSLQDIEEITRGFEPTPSSYMVLDIRSLLQEASIAEVDMEDSMDIQSDPDKDEKKEEAKSTDKQADEKKPEDLLKKDEEKEDNPETTGFGRFTISSKWDDLDSSCSKLDRLDGFTAARKPRPTIQDWLQIPDETAFTSDSSASLGSKKRVRWADVEERSKQAKMKAMGFVVGHTDWSRMMDPTSAQSKLTQTKYI